MKRIHNIHFKFYQPKANGLKVFVISDIHFSYQVSSQKLNAIAKFAKREAPKYILIPGDLVDSNDMISDANEEKRLLSFFEKLAKIAPVIMCLGNHDSYKTPDEEHNKVRGKKVRWQPYDNSDFQARVRAIKNVHLLDNEIYEDENIYVLGLTLSPHYYHFSENQKRATLFHPLHELPSEFLHELENVKGKYYTKLPKQKLKFLLVHSPVCLKSQHVAKKLEEFDYYVSGHMHNGVVPPLISEIFPSTRGIISPTRNLFYKGVRNTIKTSADKSIVVGAVTTFQACTGPLSPLNALYPAYSMTLEFTADEAFIQKPEIKRKYHKWPRTATRSS